MNFAELKLLDSGPYYRTGVEALGHIDVVSHLLGNRQKAERLFARYRNIPRLARLTKPQLESEGLTSRQADLMLAAFELAKRINTPAELVNVSHPTDVVRLLMPEYRLKQQEHLVVLCLDTKNNITHQQVVSQGSLNAAIIHPREIFRVAVEQCAASVILAHNHPSGDPAPSQEDITATQHIVNAGRMMQIPCLDHVILGDGVYVSLKEEGHIK